MFVSFFIPAHIFHHSSGNDELGSADAQHHSWEEKTNSSFVEKFGRKWLLLNHEMNGSTWLNMSAGLKCRTWEETPPFLRPQVEDVWMSAPSVEKTANAVTNAAGSSSITSARQNSLSSSLPVLEMFTCFYLVFVFSRANHLRWASETSCQSNCMGSEFM